MPTAGMCLMFRSLCLANPEGRRFPGLARSSAGLRQRGTDVRSRIPVLFSPLRGCPQPSRGSARACQDNFREHFLTELCWGVVQEIYSSLTLFYQETARGEVIKFLHL
ncbi:Histone-Lysine N-Methyltransferase Setd1A [Manis pentadactyla]|nr:Histone-Lysine N-Methyltransferase Setd1A [Manis pentadactyla]